MNVNTRIRFIILGTLIIGLFATLFVQLIQLTLVKGEEYAAITAELDVREITVPGARGSILDRNGLPLAYDQKSYDVQFYRDPTRNSEIDRAHYTGVIIEAIDIVEKNGGKTVDTFAIQYDSETGTYYFDWGDISPEAQKRREINWRDNMYVGDEDEIDVEEIYLLLRRHYQIPAEMGFEQARKVLSIWQDVQLSRWVAYKPIDIAYNVNIQTVAEIETHSDTLEGMRVTDSTVRIYPRGNVAAHTIGYLGRIVDPVQLEKYQLMGYRVDDLVGVEGVEQSMERYLTGNSAYWQGKRVVEIDNMAVVRNEISSSEPRQGDNVMLTIDIPLQLALEESLATNIPKIREDQIARYEENKDTDEDYMEIEDFDEVKLAEAGAAVVLDVNNGEVLAMGSYPRFDLNLFTGGIDEDVFEAMNEDPAAPLFNKAVGSKDIPGSIFKMVTGTAGLMEGVITLDTIIDCQIEYHEHIKQGAKAPRCHTRYKRNHANQTIVEGLKNSCNYFFYTVSDGLGIEKLDKWGDDFGLSVSTGIELPGEAIGQIYEPNILYDNLRPISEQKTWAPYLVKKRIVELLYGFAEERDVVYEDALIDETADELLYYAGMEWTRNPVTTYWEDSRGVTMGEYVRGTLSDKLNISTSISFANGWHSQITSYLSQLRWAQYDTITTGVGQGVVQVTPIAVARYVAALVNGGIVYETHVVDKIVAQDGTVRYDKEPVVYHTFDDVPQRYWNAIKRGMSDVVSDEDGTAAAYFEDFKYKDKIGGKTGTAEVSTIDLENNSWFVCFAPFDEPEIAVAVYVPNGYKGGLSTRIAQDIVAFYLDRKQDTAEQTIPETGALVPMPGAEDILPEEDDGEDGEDGENEEDDE